MTVSRKSVDKAPISSTKLKVEILKPKTWVPYNPKNCLNCFAGCCTLPVLVSPEDLFHMGYVSLFEVEGPLEEVAKRLLKKGIIARYMKNRRLFVLKQKPNNDCLFLDKNRKCKIYDKRPGVCRRFPDESKRPNFCPHQVLD